MTITIIRGSGKGTLALRDLPPGRAYRGNDGALYLAVCSFSKQTIVVQLHDAGAPGLDFCAVKDEIALIDFTEVDITITEGAAK